MTLAFLKLFLVCYWFILEDARKREMVHLHSYSVLPKKKKNLVIIIIFLDELYFVILVMFFFQCVTVI